MKKGLILSCILAFFGIFIQISFLPALGFTGAVPNIVVAVMVSAALFYGKIVGLSIGFIAGLIIDLLTGYGLGLSAVPLAAAGFMTGVVAEYINNEHFLTAMACSLIALMMIETFSAMVLYLSRMNIVISWHVIWMSMLTMLETMLAAGAFHLWLDRIYTDKSKSTRSMYLN